MPKVKQEALAANLIPVKRELLQLEAPEPGVAGVVAAASREPFSDDETVLGIPSNLLTTQDIVEHELSPVYPAQPAFSCFVRCPQQNSDDDVQGISGDGNHDMKSHGSEDNPVSLDVGTTAPGHLTPKRRIKQKTAAYSSLELQSQSIRDWTFRRHGALAYSLLPAPAR